MRQVDTQKVTTVVFNRTCFSEVTVDNKPSRQIYVVDVKSAQTDKSLKSWWNLIFECRPYQSPALAKNYTCVCPFFLAIKKTAITT